MSLVTHAIRSGISPALPAFFTIISTITKKVIDFVKTYFQFMQWSCLIAYGAKEIIFDKVTDFSKRQQRCILITPANRINNFLNRIFVKKEPLLGPIKYNVAHGLLYGVSGILGSAAAMHHLNWINVGSAAVPLEMAGNATFAFASFISLVQNVKMYRAAAKIQDDAPAHEREASGKLKKSAVLGIISSLNYIVAAALLMFDVTAVISLIFGCIAVITGCIKVLYDYIQFKNAY
jgi:hypothetical protein